MDDKRCTLFVIVIVCYLMCATVGASRDLQGVPSSMQQILQQQVEVCHFQDRARGFELFTIPKFLVRLMLAAHPADCCQPSHPEQHANAPPAVITATSVCPISRRCLDMQANVAQRTCTCVEGYTAQAQQHGGMQCERNAVVSVCSTTVALSVGHPHLTGAGCENATAAADTVCTVACDPGYHAAVGAEVVTCAVHSWSATPLCIEDGCEPFSPTMPENLPRLTPACLASLVDGKVPSRTACDVTCGAGYHANVTQATCAAGTWAPVECQELGCSTIIPTSEGTPHLTGEAQCNSGTDAPPGTMCTVACDQSYHPSAGAASVRCGVGVWSPTPSCTRNVILTAGYGHVCNATDPSGVLECWGMPGNEVPGNFSTTNWASIDAGWQATCGIMDDTVLQCWGEDKPAAGGPGWVSVSVGRWGSCAINATGQMTCWGEDPLAPAGELSTAKWAHASVIFLAACGILDSGRAKCWSGRGLKLSVPAEYTDRIFTAVSTGWQHACGIMNDSSMACWGDDSNGQRGNASDLAAKSWSSVSAGQHHTCAIRGPASGVDSGRVECRGAHNPVLEPQRHNRPWTPGYC